MCIVQKWRGETPAEALHHEGASESGHPLRRVCELNFASLKTLGTDQEDELIIHIMDGGIAVIGVCCQRYAQWQRSAYPQMKSKLGELWREGRYGKDPGFHGIVLVHWESEEFTILDPWFSADDQPMLMAKSALSKCFNGIAVFVDRLPSTWYKRLLDPNETP